MTTGIRDPNRYSDKSELWEEEHFRRRCNGAAQIVNEQMMKEHRENPFGFREHHSLDLQRLDRLLKTYPANGCRYVPLLDRDKKWKIMIFRRHEAATKMSEHAFETLDDVVHEIFLKRLKALRQLTEGQGHA